MDQLLEVKDCISCCVKCNLWLTRKNVVPGYGNITAKLMLIGEANGQSEDEQGKPFVGRAGQLLNKFLDYISLKREDVFITNILKCRPPNNRVPEEEEIVACLPFLEKQIEIISPRVIISLGATATKVLLNDYYLFISKVRGNWKEYRGTKVMPTFHPSFLLRGMTDEKMNKVREDFKKAKEEAYKN